MEYPKLIHIDAFPLEHSGQKVIGLRDPSSMTDKIVVVPLSVFFIVSLFDGKHSLLDIKAEYMRKYGEMIFTERLEEIVSYLDDHYLLESEKYEAYRKQVEDEFRACDHRPAVFAGKSYASDPEKLVQQLDSFFIEGPGEAIYGQRENRVKGIVAPHIDFQRGGPCYAWAYKELAESPVPDLFVILGTVHTPTKNPFVLTRKNFETPLGAIPTDGDLVALLDKKVRANLFDDEIVHKTEHTIEFQLVFLRYLYRNKQTFRVVPILCGSFYDSIDQGISLRQKPHVSDFVDALKETVEECGDNTCFVASADLAHVGLRFGDPAPPSPAALQQIERDDRNMLACVENMDAEGFFDFVSREEDRRKICGLPPIYTLLKVMDAREGKLLSYQQSVEPNGSSVVSFASMVFT